MHGQNQILRKAAASRHENRGENRECAGYAGRYGEPAISTWVRNSRVSNSS